jgi:hypothetical protein
MLRGKGRERAMADDWALERAREIFNEILCGADSVKEAIAAELRKERAPVVRCHSCGGTQMYKRENNEIVVIHDCCSKYGKYDNAHLRRAEAAEKRVAALEAALRSVPHQEHCEHSLRLTKAEIQRVGLECTCIVSAINNTLNASPAAPADDHDKQIIEALKALVTETCEHLEALVKITREGMQEPVEAAKRRRLRGV